MKKRCRFLKKLQRQQVFGAFFIDQKISEFEPTWFIHENRYIYPTRAIRLDVPDLSDLED